MAINHTEEARTGSAHADALSLPALKVRGFSRKMMNGSRILTPLLFARQGDNGQCEVRLITCTASSEVRVYSRESVSDANKELRLENCRVFLVEGQPAPKFVQRQIMTWQQAGFRRLSCSGRTFDFRTRTLTEGVGAIMDNTLPVMPAIRAPWWFT